LDRNSVLEVEMIGKLGAVALNVNDQDAAERFWTEGVDFEVRAKLWVRLDTGSRSRGQKPNLVSYFIPRR
jgi:hypothetical protein